MEASQGSEQRQGHGWSLSRRDGKVRVCDSLSGCGGSASCLLSCDKSIFLAGETLGKGMSTLRSFWRICLHTVWGVQRKPPPASLPKPSAQKNQYARAAHLKVEDPVVL